MIVRLVRFALVCTLALASPAVAQMHLGGPNTFDTGIRTYWNLVVEDFDEDGHLDLFVLEEDGYSVVLGDGHGSFGAPHLVNLGFTYASKWADAADFDMDGHLDVFIARQQTETIEIFHGAGDGTFSGPTLLLDVNRRTHSFVATDMDGDGDPDFALGNRYEFRVYRNDAGALVQIFEETLPWGVVRPLAEGDFNEDGHADFAVHADGGTAVYLSDGVGGFAAGVLYPPVTVPAVADFDGDGHLDLLCTGNSESVVFLGDGAGAFPSSSVIDHPGFVSGPAVTADFDNDGDIDFATDNSVHNTLTVFFNDGSGTSFTMSPHYLSGPCPRDIVAADFDRDGNQDLVVGVFSLEYGIPGTSLLLGDGNGGFDTSRAVIASIESLQDVVLADFDGDGRTDFAAVSDDDRAIEVYLQQPDGRFTSAGMLTTVLGASILEAGDLTGDGVVDLVVAGYDRLECFVGEGTGAFTGAGSITVPFGAGPFVIGSFDDLADSHADLVVSLRDAPGVTFLEGDGNGGFALGLTAETEVGSLSLASGDFDGDGHLDVVNSDGHVRFGSGFGTFPGSIDFDLGGKTVQVGDVNGDGDLDFVVTTPGGVRSYLGDGSGRFVPSGVTAVTDDLDLTLADLDGDGVLDIATVGDDRLFAYRGDGTGAFTSAFEVASGDNITSIHSGDIDGDGLADVATTSRFSDAVVLHVNKTFFYGCRAGTVNAGAGPVTDVLFVNGSAGHGVARKVAVDKDAPFEIFMDAAPADSSSVFALYAYLELPRNSTIRVMPFQVGLSCRTNPVTDVSPSKLKKIWNNTGKAALGTPDLAAAAAPTIVLSLANGIGIEADVFLQGIISDSGSAASKPGSMTNGIVIVSK